MGHKSREREWVFGDHVNLSVTAQFFIIRHVNNFLHQLKKNFIIHHSLLIHSYKFEFMKNISMFIYLQ
jgi:hypothetical protein